LAAQGSQDPFAVIHDVFWASELLPFVNPNLGLGSGPKLTCRKEVFAILPPLLPAAPRRVRQFAGKIINESLDPKWSQRAWRHDEV
jgi:hypothetical protein